MPPAVAGQGLPPSDAGSLWRDCVHCVTPGAMPVGSSFCVNLDDYGDEPRFGCVPSNSAPGYTCPRGAKPWDDDLVSSNDDLARGAPMTEWPPALVGRGTFLLNTTAQCRYGFGGANETVDFVFAYATGVAAVLVGTAAVLGLRRVYRARGGLPPPLLAWGRFVADAADYVHSAVYAVTEAPHSVDAGLRGIYYTLFGVKSLLYLVVLLKRWNLKAPGARFSPAIRGVSIFVLLPVKAYVKVQLSAVALGSCSDPRYMLTQYLVFSTLTIWIYKASTFFLALGRAQELRTKQARGGSSLQRSLASGRSESTSLVDPGDDVDVSEASVNGPAGEVEVEVEVGDARVPHLSGGRRRSRRPSPLEARRAFRFLLTQVAAGALAATGAASCVLFFWMGYAPFDTHGGPSGYISAPLLWTAANVVVTITATLPLVSGGEVMWVCGWVPSADARRWGFLHDTFGCMWTGYSYFVLLVWWAIVLGPVWVPLMMISWMATLGYLWPCGVWPPTVLTLPFGIVGVWVGLGLVIAVSLLGRCLSREVTGDNDLDYVGTGSLRGEGARDRGGRRPSADARLAAKVWEAVSDPLEASLLRAE